MSFLLQEQVFGKFPHYNARRDADIQTVLGAELWYFQTAVAHVHHTLQHAFDFIAKDDSIALSYAFLTLCGQGFSEML